MFVARTRPCATRFLRFNSTIAPDPPETKKQNWRQSLFDRRTANVSWIDEHLALGSLRPPDPPALTEAQQRQIGPKAVETFRMWNQRNIAHNLVFYHHPLSNGSVKARSLILKVFHNAADHPLPLRFLLDLREEIPSPDLFRETLYFTGQPSFRIFMHPTAPPTHVATAAMVYDIATANPELLAWPIPPFLYQGPGASRGVPGPACRPRGRRKNLAKSASGRLAPLT
ncbi:hypothetical protein FB451DRAFT_1397273 [Mycena latifolia]|nr:hypothetical protein FB451DRAFT_1397273 [Mycena latifolia]